MTAPDRSAFASFVEVARCLNSSLELHAVLGRLLEGVERLLAPTNWSLLLRDAADDRLRFVLVRSSADQHLIGVRLQPGEGVAGWVADTGETVLIADVARDERFSPRMDDRTGFATRSIVAVPLRSGTQIIGVLEIINALDERCFDESDVEILEAFAQFAAVAIENARVHGALVEANRNDPLTGLRNSTFFLSAVEEAVQRGERFALVFFDMDHFKTLVDTYGHVRGSAALAEVGRLLASSLHEGEMGCRFGGDEFAFLLVGADAQVAAQRANDLARAIREHTFLRDEAIDAHLGASFGWAAYPEDAGSATQLLNLADERMYAAKRARKQARD